MTARKATPARFVEELGRELSGPALDIFEGRTTMPPERRAAYLALLAGEPPATPAPRSGNPLPVLPRMPPCRWEGRVVERCQSCGGGEPRHRRACSHPRATSEPNDTGGAVIPGLCTREFVAAELTACDGCEYHSSRAPAAAAAPPAPPARMEWVSTANLAADAVVLAGKLPPDIIGVVGLPRSGMIPAAIVAAHLHLPLYELPTKGGPRRLDHGSRGRSFGFPTRAGRLAVVDDTVYAGGAMARARQQLAGVPAVFAAVYVRPEAVGADVFARLLPCPHLLEWNLFNCGVSVGSAANPIFGAGVGADLDGVILHDDLSGGVPGTPYLTPRALSLPLIVTGRPEAARGATEAALRRWGVRWDRLEMLPDGVPLTVESAAAHKARHYAASRLGFFVESCPDQAERIHRLTGKPVICPRAGRVF